MTPEGLAALAALGNSITVFGLGTIIIAALVLGWVVTRRTHEQIIALITKRAEDAERQRDEAIAGWKAQTAATEKLTSAVERMGARRRRYDAEGDDSPRGTPA